MRSPSLICEGVLRLRAQFTDMNLAQSGFSRNVGRPGAGTYS
jgi:hypothetical protein